MTHIEQIKNRIAAINVEIAPLLSERRTLEQLLLQERSEFVVGDLIEWSYGVGMVAVGRVTGIRQWVCGDPLWLVARIRKDGTTGHTCKVHSYQKPKKK